MSSTRVLTATLLVAALVVYSAQGMLVPVLAPVTRLVGLGEVDLGAVMTMSAAMLVLSGPWWGRQVDRIGVHAVLVRGLLIATVGATGFAVVTEIAAREELPRWLVLSAFALTRGVLYGLGFAAVPVAGLTYLASTSRGTVARTRAMGAFGAAQGLSLVIGPALGGLAAIGSLLLPVHLAPVLVFATLVAVWLLPAPERQERPEHERLGFGDPRVLPYLVAGGALFLGLALVEIILGFLVQDRLGLSDTETAQVVAVAGVLIGVGFAVTQAFVAPRVPGGPRGLLITGSLLATSGYVGAMFTGSTGTLLAAMVVIAAGLGLALPGFNAGATLTVEPAEHAAVAGQLSATVGLTYVAGPVLGAALYSLYDLAPIMGAALLSLLAAGLASRLNRTA